MIASLIGINQSRQQVIIPKRTAQGSISKRGVYFPLRPRLINNLFLDYKSADGELLVDFVAVRSVARQLSKTNDLASRYLDLVSNNVMGSQGIILQPALTDDAGEPDEELNQAIEEIWEEWGECVSADGKMSWLDAQDYIARTVARDGEVFINFICGPEAGNRFGFALQFIESDMLDQFNNEGPTENGNSIKMGIEVDQYNRPVAYHFFDPSKIGPLRPVRGAPKMRVPAEQVLHLYRHNASSTQTRGISWMTPVILPLYSFNDYMEAEQEALALIANNVVFFESTDALGTFSNTDVGVNPGNSTSDGSTGPLSGPQNPPQEMITIAPGTPTVLPPGLTAKPLPTNHPGTSFQAWCNKRLQGISSGLNVSYAALTGDLTQGNNSSLREGARNERDYWQKIQSWYIGKCHQAIYREFIKQGIKYGAFQGIEEMQSVVPSDYYKVNWQPRGYTGYDAYKDANSYGVLVQNGIKSRTQIITELGGDPDKVFKELASENAKAKELGINIDGIQINSYEVKAGSENQPNLTEADDDDETTTNNNGTVEDAEES